MMTCFKNWMKFNLDEIEEPVQFGDLDELEEENRLFF